MKRVLLCLPLLLLAPLVLFVMGMGAATTVAAACATTVPGSADGTVAMVQANLPSKTGYTDQGPAGIRLIAAADPDFVTLNEQTHRSLTSLTSATTGYHAYRDLTADPLDAGGGALENVVMWNAARWTETTAGRVRLITQKMENGEVRSRYATWVILQSVTDPTNLVAVVATHLPVNPQGVGGQGGVIGDRAVSYGQGMDNLVALLAQLRTRSGAVLVGGDFNDHPSQTQPWAAVPHMTAAGYRFTDSPASGIDYVFYPATAQLLTHSDLPTDGTSDHPDYNLTRLNLTDTNTGTPSDTDTGAGSSTALAARAASSSDITTRADSPAASPAGMTGTTTTGTISCAPCPAITSNAPSGTLQEAEVAAAAAYQAGFRGDDLVTAVAIAGVESSWNPEATNGSHSGLWQIAAIHRGMVPGWDTSGDILAPVLNADYAYALYQRRPGAGEAKFADWLPFESVDYHQNLDLAQQAVDAATGDGVPNTGVLNTDFLNTDVLNTDVLNSGVLTPDATTCTFSWENTVGHLSTALSARMGAMLHTPDGLCALSWTRAAPCTYDNQCPKVVDALYGGPGTGRGYGNGQDVAQGIIDAGLARASGTGLDPLPPVGAVVSYNTGNGTGHVAIYVGDGKIFGNDYGCTANGIYGCVGFSDVHTPGGSVTWALPTRSFDLGGMPSGPA